MYITFFSLKIKITIYLGKKTQIISLNIKKILKNVLFKYLNFVDIFSKKLGIKVSKRLGINKYIIDLETSKKPLYRLIYSLKLVKLKILKTYIKTHLANGFI